MAQYDALVVGAGLYGSVYAHECRKRGLRVLVIDSRDVIGGNCHTSTVDGIVCHTHGPHLFRTNQKWLWDYVNSFTPFNEYRYQPKIIAADGMQYSMPINLESMYRVFGTRTPRRAREAVANDIRSAGEQDISTLEGWSISQVGPTMHSLFIKKYTECQWNRPASELPASIIKRLPIRYSYSSDYFDERWQGCPTLGYTDMCTKMLEGVSVSLNTPYEHSMHDLADKIVYTGPIDGFFNYELGPLEYRSLRFETRYFKGDQQGVSAVNYANGVPFTRSIEHAHFSGQPPKHFSVVTKEFPQDWDVTKTPYYPINTKENQDRYNKYRELARCSSPKVTFAGRLGRFRYWNMDQIIAAALHDIKKEYGEANGTQEAHRRRDTASS